MMSDGSSHQSSMRQPESDHRLQDRVGSLRVSELRQDARRKHPSGAYSGHRGAAATSSGATTSAGSMLATRTSLSSRRTSPRPRSSTPRRSHRPDHGLIHERPEDRPGKR